MFFTDEEEEESQNFIPNGTIRCCPKCGSYLELITNGWDPDVYRCSNPRCTYKEDAEGEEIGAKQTSTYKQKKRRTAAKNSKIILEFSPPDEEQFKKLLIEKKKARRILFDKNGVEIEVKIWKAKNFSNSSKLRVNIQSSQIYKQAIENGVAKIKWLPTS